jgi:Flp pilus assembly protein TadD
MGDPGQALADRNRALELAPDEVSLYHARGHVHARLGDEERAIADNLEALKRRADDARTCNNLAWLYATASRQELRDPARAVELARKAVERGGGKDLGHLDTLAVALAAAGQFEEAVKEMTRAIELAPQGEQEEYRRRLELFQQGKGYEPTLQG